MISDFKIPAFYKAVEGDHLEIWLSWPSDVTGFEGHIVWKHFNADSVTWTEYANPASDHGDAPLRLRNVTKEMAGFWLCEAKAANYPAVSIPFHVEINPAPVVGSAPKDKESDDYIVPSHTVQMQGLELSAQGLLKSQGNYHIGDLSGDDSFYTVALIPDWNEPNPADLGKITPRIKKIFAEELNLNGDIGLIKDTTIDYGTLNIKFHIAKGVSGKNSARVLITIQTIDDIQKQAILDIYTV